MTSIESDSGFTTHAHDPIHVLERGARAHWWRRVGSKEEGFHYLDYRGQPITDEVQIARIQHLAIPPGYPEVRIAPSPRSRLQAIALDTHGRIQYRYSEKHTESQKESKFHKIEAFGEHLPALRRVTNHDLSLEGFPREKTLAVVIRLINDLYFRLGSEGSVDEYHTFGVTTLRNYHLHILPGDQLMFRFVGKHHIRQRRILVDAELAHVLRELKELGGIRLFNWVDERGIVRPVTPSEVNAYIKHATAPEFSGKDFRTWGGTLLAAEELAAIGPDANANQRKRNIVAAVKRVAERLGNTPAVCREAYIHPVVFQRYEEGVTLADFRARAQRIIQRQQAEYAPEELALLKLFHPDKPLTQAGESSNGGRSMADGTA